MKKTGIQITADGDLALLEDGKLQTGNTLYQNQYMILKAQKGDFKEYPLLGVGIDEITNDEDTLEWKKRIRENFSYDELVIDSISISNNQTFIVADYD